MSDLSTFSSMKTMIQTSDIVWQTVSLTDELKINLEYDIHRGVLNIFLKNANNTDKLPYQINVIPEDTDKYETISNSTYDSSISSELHGDLTEVIYDNEPKIYYEISTTYYYDINDENENTDHIDLSQTMITSSSSFCFDDQTIDNDDGYSTNSLDDIEQQHNYDQQSLVMPSSKLILPGTSFPCHYYSEQYVSPVRQLIEQMTWSNPFRKTIQNMMMNHLFH